MTNFSTLLRHVLSFHTAALWLLFLRCSVISTLGTMLRHVYFFHAAAPYLLFPRCCAVSSFSTLLRYVYFFPRGCCAMTPFSMIDRTEQSILNPFGKLLLCLLGKSIPNYGAYVNLFLFRSFNIPVSKQ